MALRSWGVSGRASPSTEDAAAQRRDRLGRALAAQQRPVRGGVDGGHPHAVGVEGTLVEARGPGARSAGPPGPSPPAPSPWDRPGGGALPGAGLLSGRGRARPRGRTAGRTRPAGTAARTGSNAYCRSPRKSCFTSMRFWVSVPVLSVQITVVDPSVPTDGRWRMSTFRRAMRWVASTRARVSVGSRPSGTMATMMPIAKMKASQNGTPRKPTDGKEDHPDQHREDADPSTQMLDLLAQRGDRAGGGSGEARDLAELGLHPGGEDDGLGLARYHRGPGEQDVAAVEQVIGVARRRLSHQRRPARR